MYFRLNGDFEERGRTRKERIELHKLDTLDEDLITEVAKLFPDIAEKYFYIKDQIE